MARLNLPRSGKDSAGNRSGGREPFWLTLLKLAGSVLIALLGRSRKAPGQRRADDHPQRRTTTTSGAQELVRLFNNRQSDAIVSASGTIVKILRDECDTHDGSGQHQRLLVEITPDLTIKISHNLAFGRIPARVGDELKFKGEYEWNERGGSVHWTHHDPKQWHEDGWLEYEGKRYG